MQVKQLTDAQLARRVLIAEARNNFLAYRILINRKKYKDIRTKKNKYRYELMLGWWVKEVAQELQGFLEAMERGENPILVIEAPPQHGKSTAIMDFITWYCGRNPETANIIYSSFSRRLSIRANLRVQKVFDSEEFKEIFPEVSISDRNRVTTSRQKLRNREIIELNNGAYFRNTTVGGSITGETMRLGVIDDPVKGRAEANSLTIRDKVWDWFLDDFLSRRSKDAGIIFILTRWHVDDVVGRMKKEFGDSVKCLTYKALAIEDEKNRKAGEALFEELKPAKFLERTKQMLRNKIGQWEALYQQNPTLPGGNIIKTNYFKRYTKAPFFKYRKIFVDTAMKTKERHDYSVFQCWGLGEDGHLYLIDQIRGKWESPELKRKAQDFWNKHKAADLHANGALRGTYVEDKASGTGLIQELVSKFPVIPIPRHIDKYTRVCDILDYIETGRVYIPENAEWVSDLLSECETFDGTDKNHDDQIDPLVDAINDMIVENNVVDLWAKSR